ncbi:MAG: hypothetical protein KC609_04670, partial [Myxococcales bacterium]|nr:hypothetical protein [Myxococcales bacterium]
PLDHRSDLFSVGMVLYEMLTGVNFYADENEFNQMERVKKVDLELPTKLNPKVHPDLERVLMKALHVDVHQRYPRTLDFADALGEYAERDEKRFSDADMKQFMASAFSSDLDEELRRMKEIMSVRWPSPGGPPVVPDAPEEDELELGDDLVEIEEKPVAVPPPAKAPRKTKQMLMLATLGLIVLLIVLMIVVMR